MSAATHIRFASICAALAVFGLVATTAGSASGQGQSCAPKQARTLAADPLATVFASPVANAEGLKPLLVCAHPSGRPIPLAREHEQVRRPVALDGAWAAGVAVGSEPQDFFYSDAVALNALTHQRTRCRIGGANQPGGAPTAIRLYVSQRSGSVAWSSILRSETPTPSIGICTDGQTRILDEGAGVNLRSLSASGRQLHWLTAGGQERSFTFR